MAIDQRGLEVRAAEGLIPGLPAGYIEQAEAIGLGSRQYELLRIEL